MTTLVTRITVDKREMTTTVEHRPTLTSVVEKRGPVGAAGPGLDLDPDVNLLDLFETALT